MVKVCDMQIHLASLCKFRPVHCANGCGVCLPEVELAEHVKYVSSWSACTDVKTFSSYRSQPRLPLQSESTS